MKLLRTFGFVATALAVAFSATSASAQGPWTGLYLGANVGYGTAADTNPKVNGVVGGIHGGYNWQFNQIVAGIEGDYSFSGMNAATSIAGTTFDMDVDSIWSIRARLGFLATSNLMIFGTVGYGGFEANVTATGATIGSASTRANGLVAGGGLEYAFTRNIVGRLEGLHFMGEGTGAFSGIDQDVTIFRTGLSYKF